MFYFYFFFSSQDGPVSSHSFCSSFDVGEHEHEVCRALTICTPCHAMPCHARPGYLNSSARSTQHAAHNSRKKPLSSSVPGSQSHSYWRDSSLLNLNGQLKDKLVLMASTLQDLTNYLPNVGCRISWDFSIPRSRSHQFLHSRTEQPLRRLSDGWAFWTLGWSPPLLSPLACVNHPRPRLIASPAQSSPASSLINYDLGPFPHRR